MADRRNVFDIQGERKQQHKELAELMRLLAEARRAYELYFIGIEKRVPVALREKLDRQFRSTLLARAQLSTVRFQFQSLQQSYITYRTYWERVTRQIEEGTFTREGFGKFQKGPLTPGRVRSGEAEAERERVDSDPERLKSRVKATSDEASAFLDKLTDKKS
jgi:hypothetical protein